MDLKIYIRQGIVLDKFGNKIYYTGTNPNNLTVNTGSIPTGRAWTNYPNWIDATQYVSDLFKLKLTWTTERDEAGNVVPGGLNPKKSASGTITFEGEGFQLIKSWLLDDISAPVNSIDVRIEQMGCGFYEDYSFKSTDISWCEDNICTFDVNFKQRDEYLNCIKKTLISDNWQGWFQTVPQNGKKHPRFSYCRKVAGFQLQSLWYIMNTLFGSIITIMFPVVLGYNALLVTVIAPIVGTINAIISFINALGASINPINTANLKPINLRDIYAPFGQFFVEVAGCGREHPAPLIRDYIKNVCDKCNVQVDGDSAPIFFAQTISIETSNPDRPNSNKGFITTYNPHYNACYFFPQTKRGIRRYNNLVPPIPPFTNNDRNTTDFYIPENAPLLALDQFLDQLKEVYNAEWRLKSYVRGNGTVGVKLEFKRKDQFYINPSGYAFDFTENGADRDKVLSGLCYEWTGEKNPAAVKGIYALDASNKSGDEERVYTDSYLSFDTTDNNPTYEGILDKTVQFGAAKFRLDGASTDYIYDSLQVVANGATISPIPSFTFNLDQAADYIREFCDYAVLLDNETVTLPKIIIWDGNEYLNARAIKNYYLPTGEPEINPKYNNYLAGVAPLSWKFQHRPETFVKGSGSNLGSFPPDFYTVRTALGIAVITQQPAVVMNYPMFFEHGYYDTLWDWYHWIDDPKRKGQIKQSWSIKIKLCCEDLQTLGVFGEVNNIILGEKVKLPLRYNQDGRITEITVSYDTEDSLGQYIEIKGIV